MSWPIIWHESLPGGPWEPGWAFPLLWHPSKHFVEHVRGTRPPITVAVPVRGIEQREGVIQCTSFCVDAHPSDNPDGGWTVTVDGPMHHRQPLLLTVRASIHAVGIYHGWIADGVLSDDIGS